MAFRARILLSTSAFLFTGLVASSAHAGGFYVPEVGGRSIAMANAMTAQSEDTTALFHNVAGIAGLGGTNIQVGALGVMPRVEYFRRPTTNQAGDRVTFDPVRNTNAFGVVPNIGVTSDVGVKNLGIGLGVFVPFGAHIVYPEDGAQRYVATEVDFKTIYVTPSVAYKAWDRFSFGVGLSYIYGAIDLAQASNFQHVLGQPEDFPDPDFDGPGEGTNHLSAHDTASFGANIGLQYTDPGNRFGFGVSVMVPTTLEFEGKAVLRNEAILPIQDSDGNEILPEGIRRDDFTMDYPLPLILRAGMMVRPHEQVMVALDVNWQRWETFDKLVVDFKNNYPLQNVAGAVAWDVVIDQNWKNSLSIRAGVDGQPTKKVPLFLRAGVLFDESPIPDRYFDVLAPESDKVGVSGGLGYQLDIKGKARMDFDVAYMHLFFAERNIKPVKVGPDNNSGNDDNDMPIDDTVPNPDQGEIPGSDKTILNKPSPSFFHGVYRAAFDLLGLSISVRI